MCDTDDDIEQYRHNSLPANAPKALERFIFNSLYPQIGQNLHESHLGFRQKHQQYLNGIDTQVAFLDVREYTSFVFPEASTKSYMTIVRLIT